MDDLSLVRKVFQASTKGRMPGKEVLYKKKCDIYTLNCSTLGFLILKLSGTFKDIGGQA